MDSINNRTDFRQRFIEFTLAREALRFGRFETKAGRQSPYFFNAGSFNDGASLLELGQFYAQAIIESQLAFDMLFGPAYKGIPLAVATAIALARTGRNHSFAFNRKESKDHGEGGDLVGAPLKGRVLIIDDVITAGTAARESVDIIRRAGAIPAGMIIALDRMERGTSTPLSAVEEVQEKYRVPVVPIACLDDLLTFLDAHPNLDTHRRAIYEYRSRYGVVNK